jgi:hypothetical protein
MLSSLTLLGCDYIKGTILLLNFFAPALGACNPGLVMRSHGHSELELLFAVLTPVIVDRHTFVLSLRAERHLKF